MPHAMAAADLLASAEQAMRCGRYATAEAQFNRILAMRGASAPALCGLAWLSWARDRDLAGMRNALERAHKVGPRDPVVHTMAANLHLISGDLERASKAALRALRADPAFVHAYGVLDEVAPIGSASVEAKRIRRLADRRELSAGRRAWCWFLLGRIAEREERHGEAFEGYAMGNRLSPNSADCTENFRNIARIVGGCAARIGNAAARGSDVARPIFIVGMPRSGTTLLEQVLARHSEVTSVGEAPFAHHHFEGMFGRAPARPLPEDAIAYRRSTLTPDAMQRWARHYLADVGSAGVVVDKCVYNFALAPLIAPALPDAVIVHCRRDPLDVAISIYGTNFARRPFGASLEQLADFYAMYQATMRAWDELGIASLVTVDYERLVADPAGTVPWVLERCGLPFEPACLAPEQASNPLGTASVTQARKAIYRSSVGRGQRFAAQLAPFLARLGEPN